MAGLEIHEAAAAGDYDNLEEYLKSSKYDINLKDAEWHNKTPLHWAASRGHADCTRLLLDYGANGSSQMDMGWTPSHCAAETGKMAVLRILNLNGVPLNKKDNYGDTPRRIAEIYGHIECIQYLMQVEQDQLERKKKLGKSMWIRMQKRTKKFILTKPDYSVLHGEPFRPLVHRGPGFI